MKMRHIKLLLIFFLLSFQSFSQSKINTTFIINGSINASKGVIRLVCKNPIDSIVNEKEISSEIMNGKFTIKGELDFPAVYSFRYINADSYLYTSDYFLIDSGVQTAEINTESSMPRLINSSMNKYYETSFYKKNQRFQKDKKWFQSFSDSLKAVYSTKMPDSLGNVLAGIAANQTEREKEITWQFYEELSDSYLSLWVLYERFYANGFEGIYNDYFSYLSDEIQQSNYGKLLRFKLNEASPTKIGAKFPFLYSYKNLKDGTYEKIKLKGNYNFIYFWWVRCGICIDQFPELKKLYETYANKGFEIIHISGDNTNELSLLQKIRKKSNLMWSEYLDENQENMKKVHLTPYFPKIFLLDKEGVIVKKNITTKELKTFLEEKYN